MPTPSKSSTIRYGAACDSCHVRKLKCDTAKPICRNCAKSRRYACGYERRGGKIVQLNRKIAELETALKELESPPESSAGSLTGTGDTSSSSSSPLSYTASTRPDIPAALPKEAIIVSTFGLEAFIPPKPTQWEIPGIFEIDLHDEIPWDLSKQLFDIFFKSLYASTILDAPALYVSLDLPLRHPRRPHPCLLFAIYTCAARLSGEPALLSLEQTFVRKAMDHLNGALDQDRHLLDVLRAYFLLGYHSYGLSDVCSGWVSIGAGFKLAMALGLHRLSPARLAAASGGRRCSSNHVSAGQLFVPGTRMTLLHEPATLQDQAQALSLWWSVFICARATSVVSLWPTCSVGNEEVTTAFTLPGLDHPLDPPHSSSQTLQSRNTFLHHPRSIGPHGVLAKAMVLAGRASRLNDPVSRESAHPGPDRLAAVRASAVFKDLDALIRTFRASLPEWVTARPNFWVEGQGDPCRAWSFAEEARMTARTVAPMAWLLLHEAHVEYDEESRTVCDSAAAEIVALITAILRNPRYDPSRLHCCNTLCWTRAGQHSARAMAAAAQRRASKEVDRLRKSTLLCIRALQRYGERWVIGVLQAQIVERALGAAEGRVQGCL